jgi:lysophospholipid acyltransferase (LPLAT)-like uncharacterized protein
MAAAGTLGRRRKVRFLHRPWVSATLAWLAAGYIRLIDRTGRWRLDCAPATEELVRAGKPFIGAFWHGRLIISHPAWRALKERLGVAASPDLYIIISTHGDGRLIQSAAHHLGAKTLSGSSRRGGARVLREAEKVLKDGHILVITPDGPRGPRMRAHRGVAYLARRAKAPVVPITFAARRHRLIGSWDRFMLVWPFAGGVIAFGEPIEVPDDGDLESARTLIEERMIQHAIEVDRAQGIDPVRPAD